MSVISKTNEEEGAMLDRRIPFWLMPSGRFSIGHPGDDHNAVGTYLLEKAGDFDDVEETSLYQGHILFDGGESFESWPINPDGSEADWLTLAIKEVVRQKVAKCWQQTLAKRARQAARS